MEETQSQHSITPTLHYSTGIVVGIITVSDRATSGEYEDLGGPALKVAAEKYGWQVLSEAIVPDDAPRIQETIRSFSDQGCGLVLLTGGTGVAGPGGTPQKIRGITRGEDSRLCETSRAEATKNTASANRSR